MSRKPPLEIVRGVRARAVDDASLAAREAARSAERARDEAEQARDEESSARASAAARLLGESNAIAAAPSPRALAQLAAFEQGLDRKRIAQQGKTVLAEERARAASLLEDARRLAVVAAKGALVTVEQHQARARATLDKKELEQLDEVAAEAHRARRR